MPSERLRDILPLLRPRSAEPTLFTQTVFALLCLGLAALALLYGLRWRRLRRQRERQFLALAANLGLSARDIDLVRSVARRRHVKWPERLLTSARDFDRHLGGYSSQLARQDLQHPGLVHVAWLRDTLGFRHPPPEQALSSTRQMERGQTVMVWEEWLAEPGHAPWLVVALDEGSLTAVPLLRSQGTPAPLLEPDQDLSAHFWREGDTEYRFRTRVISRDPVSGAFRLEHARRLERLQQRDFYRIPVHFDVTLYALPAVPAASGRGTDAAALLLLGLGGETGQGDDEEVGIFPEAGAPDVSSVDVGQLQRLDARAVDLSAGGMAVVAPPGRDPRPERWLVDPEFTGPFPLAGVICQLVDEVSGGGGSRLKLRFESLSQSVEREIVRQVYQHQLLTASGRQAGPGLALGDPDNELPPPLGPGEPED